jgi:type I restriction enzyme S subunit
MTGRYKAYSEYKKTDEVWLGNVPSHWRALKINRLTLIKRGASPRPIDDPKYFDEAGEYAWVRIADVTASDLYLENTTQKLSNLGASLSVKLEPNELFLSIAGTVGKPCINKVKACIHDGFVYFPEYKENTKFLFYIFSAGEAYKGLGKFGTQLNLNTETVGGIKIGIPCIDDQNKIVNFLDHETAKIDTLISKQEKLIELLKEKRQAVISHAVTKGLNPDASMKDSGVEWLGKVPDHWIVAKFSYEIEFLEGPGILAVDFHDEGVPLLRIQDVKEEFVTDNFKTYLDPQKVKSKWEHFRVQKGDLLISASASTGLISEVDDRTVGAIPYTGLIRLKPASSNITKDFIRFIVQSDLFYEQIKLLQTGSTIQHFGPIHLQQMKVLLPPICEQEELCKLIETSLKRIDKLIKNAADIISLTNERKIALISAAITGKIDVRDWQEQGDHK